jgi:hypothetical protein
MTENDFRSSAPLRQDLERFLQSTAFREALLIIEKRRRANEQVVESRQIFGSLPGDAMASVRLNSQRIGAEGVILDLYALCEPPVPEQAQEEAAFGKEEELRKLQESDNA